MSEITHAEGSRNPPRPTRKLIPHFRNSSIVVFTHENQVYRATGSYLDGELCEVFLAVGKCNSTLQLHAADSAILASLLLQYGIDVATILHSISGPIGKALDLLAKSPPEA